MQERDPAPGAVEAVPGGDRKGGPQPPPLTEDPTLAAGSAVGAPSVASLFRPHPETSFTYEAGRPFTEPEPPVLSMRC